MAKRSARKPVPAFGSEAEERDFWETHDTSAFVDWSEGRDVPYQSLLKVFLAERVARETAGALANKRLRPTSPVRRKGKQKHRSGAARG